jgi:hypothetical protein
MPHPTANHTRKWVARDHTQRRRRDRVITTNSVGAKTAIQSQWTYLPKSGFTTALKIMDIPTSAPAHNKAMGQLRFAGSFPGLPTSDVLLPEALLLLISFFMMAHLRFP